MEYIHIASGSLIFLIILVSIIKIIKLRKYITKLEEQLTDFDKISKKVNKVLTIDETQKYVELFDKILLDKFNFHNYANFLPLLIKGKDLNIEKIKAVKNDFYLDVSSTLCAEQKNNLLKVYSEKGIEMYIHQFFLQKLNEVDVKFRTVKDDVKNTEPSDAVMKEIYKG